MSPAGTPVSLTLSVSTMWGLDVSGGPRLSSGELHVDGMHGLANQLTCQHLTINGGAQLNPMFLTAQGFAGELDVDGLLNQHRAPKRPGERLHADTKRVGKKRLAKDSKFGKLLSKDEYKRLSQQSRLLADCGEGGWARREWETEPRCQHMPVACQVVSSGMQTHAVAHGNVGSLPGRQLVAGKAPVTTGLHHRA